MIPDLPYRPACNTSLIRFSVHGTGCSVSFVGHFSSAVFAVRCTLMHFVRSGFGPTVLTSDGLIKPGSPLWIAGIFRTIIPSKTAGRILGGKTYDRHRFVAGQIAQSLRQRLFRLRRPQTAGPHRSQVCGGEAPNRLTTCLTASRASASTGKMRDMVLARRCV